MSLFYMYPPPVDMSALAKCAQNGITSRVSEYAEVQAYYVLREHARRTPNASMATVFYMPIWEWTSLKSGTCGNTTHKMRMQTVATFLSNSPLFMAHKSRHFWITSAAQASVHDTAVPSERGDLKRRLYTLYPLLRDTISGQRKEMHKLASTASRWTFEVPYGTPVTRRPEIYFSGSYDVCCSGQRVRCKLATLVSHPAVKLVSTPRGMQSRCGRHVPVCHKDCEEAMRHHVWCIVAPGDTHKGTVVHRHRERMHPGDTRVGEGDGRAIDYRSFAVFVNSSDFLADPGRSSVRSVPSTNRHVSECRRRCWTLRTMYCGPAPVRCNTLDRVASIATVGS